MPVYNLDRPQRPATGVSLMSFRENRCLTQDMDGTVTAAALSVVAQGTVESVSSGLCSGLIE